MAHHLFFDLSQQTISIVTKNFKLKPAIANYFNSKLDSNSKLKPTDYLHIKLNFKFVNSKCVSM